MIDRKRDERWKEIEREEVRKRESRRQRRR